MKIIKEDFYCFLPVLLIWVIGKYWDLETGLILLIAWFIFIMEFYSKGRA